MKLRGKNKMLDYKQRRPSFPSPMHFLRIAHLSPPVIVVLISILATAILYSVAFSTFARRVYAIAAAAANKRRHGDDDETTTTTARPKRHRRHAFEPGQRLSPLQRGDEIVVPDWSDDTRECDDFRRANECALIDGYRACFECVESRESPRVCAHVDESMTVHNHDGEIVTLPPNSAPDKGYCVSESLAFRLRELADPAARHSGTARARRECSASNADWILVRQRVARRAADSSFNFVCRCKYPHLMSNVAGPMSACSRDVGCNGHGRLDADSRASLVDPFVNGRCECDEGWIAEYNAATAAVGPYCREATVAEWPSLVLTRRRRKGNGDAAAYLDLYSEFVDEKFRATLERQRRDYSGYNGDAERERAEVRLKNPCYPCPIATTDDSKANFCGDEVITRITDGAPYIAEARIGVRGERDYLRGNGGQLPNACITLTGDDLAHDRFLMQFLTTTDEYDDDDNGRRGGEEGGATTAITTNSPPGTRAKFAPEIGFLASVSAIEKWLFVNGGGGGGGRFTASPKYRAFARSLRRPRVAAALNGYGTIWTCNDSRISDHRQRFVESLRTFYFGVAVTDLMYRSDTLLFPFAHYYNAMVVNLYYYFPAGTNGANFPEMYRRHKAVMCPDKRELPSDAIYAATLETDETSAHDIAQSMLPVCLVRHVDSRDGREYLRPRINCTHPNPTGCVLVESDSFINYAYTLWYPPNMKLPLPCDDKRGDGD